MSFDFSTLITDRAASDLENLRALLSTPMEDWTAEQLAQFNQAISKGAYNYTDLNRVTACMEYLDETLRSYGYETGYQRILVHPDEPESISLLPEGYTQLEYIQSSGAQYIDTGFKHNQDTRVVMDIQATSISANAWAFEGRIATNSARHGVFFYYTTGNLWNMDYSGGTRMSFSEISSTDRLTIDYNKNVCSINGVTNTATAGTFQSTVNLVLLAANTGGTVAGYLNAKLYSCQIYDNGTLIRNYVPCKNSDGAVGLYDIVNNEFYNNAGTGNFMAGEKIDPYTWYEDDVPTAPQMAQYLSNVLSIWSTIMGDPTLPETMANLTQEGANQIEAALIEVNTAIEQIIAAMARSNSFTFWSGNRPFPTAYSNPGRNWAELDAMGTSWRNWQVANWYLLLYGNLEAEGDVT